jgi:hypothetical protein
MLNWILITESYILLEKVMMVLYYVGVVKWLEKNLII